MKGRIALAVVVLVLLTAILVTSVSLVLVRQGMTLLIAEQQTALLSRVSEDLDQKIIDRQVGLKFLAAHVPKDALDDPASMQQYLEQYAIVRASFDNIAVFNARGDLIANLATPSTGTGFNVAKRAYFEETIQRRESVISDPFISQLTKKPVVLVTAVVLDERGKVALVFTGSIDLQQDNFIGQLAKSKIGKSGYFYIATTSGILVTHPNPKRMLEDMNRTNGANPLFARIASGFEGTVDATSATGGKGLFSFKRLKSAPWIVGSVLPEAEAFAPIAHFQRNSILSAIILALLIGPAAWWYIRRQIAPLQKLGTRIQAIRADPAHAIIPVKYADDEIGELARAFDILIRERVYAETKFQSSAEELRAATNSSLDVFFILQSERDEAGAIIDFRFRYANPLADEQFGDLTTPVIGKNLCVLAPASRDNGVFGRYTRVVESGVALQGEIFVQTANGVTEWFHQQVVPLADGVAVTSRDITDRKKAEIEIRNSRAFLQSLTDYLPMMFYAKSMRPETFGRIVTWNHAAEAISGYSADQVVGRTSREVFSHEIASAFEQQDQTMLANPMPIDMAEHKFWRADGTVRYLHTISVPIFDDDDAVDYIICISEDVTIRHQQDIALRTRQAELQAVNDSSPLGLFMTDVAGNCIYINRTYESISGLSFAQVDGNGWVEMIDATERNRAIEQWALSIHQKQSYQNIHRLQRADDQIVWVSIKAVPVLLDGLVTGYIGSVDDITARREAEQMLLKSEQRLRLIADNIPALIGYVDSNERFLFGNHKYEAAFQSPHHELEGKHASEVLGADVYAQSKLFIRDALAGIPAHFERLVTGVGSLRWERVSYVPDRDMDGTIAGYFSLVENITELKQAQHTFAKSEMRLRMITDNLPALIAYIDRDQHYRFCNGYYEIILGISPDKLIGRSVREVLGEQAYLEVADYIVTVLNGQRTSFERYSPQRGRHFLYDYIPDIGIDGKVVGYYSMVLDITARKDAELKQAAGEKLLRAVTDHLPVLVSFIDRDERFQFNNRLYEKWLARPLSEITGKRVEEVYGSAIYARYKPHYDRALLGETAEFEFKEEREGTMHFYQAAYMPQFDAEGKPSGVCGMINDITDLKLVENQLRILARFDSLTGLPNRSQFDEKLAEAIARSNRSGSPMAVMFLDIDHFKSINDTLGHQGGDEVLREFAQRLLHCVRKTDTVSRLAGDEFVIILEGLRMPEECEVVADKIIRAMKNDFKILGATRNVTTSIGIAVRRDDEIDGEMLLRRADDALYAAKAAGRNMFQCVA
ncbi:MAG: PAS domain-containing protein [Herminiimonas sp.]|nr:PAS domain-containing protein [Herminiimonas sp.]